MSMYKVNVSGGNNLALVEGNEHEYEMLSQLAFSPGRNKQRG